MSQAPTPTDRIKRPLDAAKLDELALAYVARFATSKGKLARYLSRKVRESKWIDAQDSNEALADAVARMERLGYLDDRHYAQMKSGAMMRRGLGPQRVRAQLRFDGVDEADSDAAITISGEDRLMAAVRFARRKRLGPFAAEAMGEAIDDRSRREKQIAAFLRAGHDMALARRILAMAPMDMPQLDDVVAWLSED